MNIDKAIQSLKDLVSTHAYIQHPDTLDAIKLGIQGLHRLEDLRKGYPISPQDPLTGETKD